MNGTPWRTCPRLAADALRAVYEPGSTWLRAGRAEVPATVARIMATALQPPCAPDQPPGFLRQEQHRTFGRLLAAIRRHRGALLADPVGSGKTWIALAVAKAMAPGETIAVIAPAALRNHWSRVASLLEADIAFRSATQVSAGRLTLSCDFAIVDESHHFRTRTTRRYAHLSRWLMGRQALLLSATPVVNRLDDLAAQLRLVIRDDALAASGVGSISVLLASGTGHPALADLIVARPPAPAVGTGRRTIPVADPGADLIAAIDRLELSREHQVAALVRRVLWRALSSSPAALHETLTSYEALLTHAAAAASAGRTASRAVIRAFTGADEQQLVMWEILGEPGDPVLSLGDLPALRAIARATRDAAAQDDPKVVELRNVLADGRPTLVFSTRRATVRYLRQRLEALRPAWCTGNAAGVGGLLASRTQLLEWFALGSRSPVPVPTILLATDVAAEGLDLARLTRVVHYDMPWTAARVEQREGRSRRGPAADSVEAIILAPAPAIEARLELAALVERKRSLPRQVDVGAEAGRLWRWRETLLATVGASTMAGPACAAIESGAAGALAVVEITEEREGTAIVGRVAMHVSHTGELSEDPSLVASCLSRAASITGSAEPLRSEVAAALTLLAPHVRSLLKRHEAAAWWRHTRGSRRIIGRLASLAREARRARNRDRLSHLEVAMRAMGGGRTAGEDGLAVELEAASDDELVRRAGTITTRPPQGILSARIAGLLILRDGTLPFPNGHATFGRHEAP